ncbi:MAG: peptidoglycan-binding protein [Eubacteriales bacterium]|nr:peptidoglycan-binding protein [Eubacteriales bacterium]
MAITVPENITVHLGPPGSDAPNVTVPFADYIKNVASSEIYPTWPENALRANILAEISFALNRIYTEYYRSRGYDFDITNSTAYDQSYRPDRDIFENISQIVDDIFNDYIVREGQVQPLFAQYCDGREVQCAGLSQWGTVTLANEGLLPYEILQRYYGDDINIVFDAPVGNIEESYPGTPLRPGDGGEEVRQLQLRLNRIGQNYPTITNIPETNGIFGVQTERAVRDFQRIFNLEEDGVVGKATWYKIINVYNGVKRLSELNSEGISPEEVRRQFETVLQRGSYGVGVGSLQALLDALSGSIPELPPLSVDLIFGPQTEEAVRTFQSLYGLPETGEVDRATWNALLGAYETLLRSLPNENNLYPGIILTEGMEGENVLRLQRVLNRAAANNPSLPSVAEDGVFGPATRRAVEAVQQEAGLTPTGIAGPLTWNAILRAGD